MLSVLTRWNPDLAPKHFMVEYAEEEISAVDDLFLGAFDFSKYVRVFGFAMEQKGNGQSPTFN